MEKRFFPLSFSLALSVFSVYFLTIGILKLGGGRQLSSIIDWYELKRWMVLILLLFMMSKRSRFFNQNIIPAKALCLNKLEDAYMVNGLPSIAIIEWQWWNQFDSCQTPCLFDSIRFHRSWIRCYVWFITRKKTSHTEKLHGSKNDVKSNNMVIPWWFLCKTQGKNDFLRIKIPFKHFIRNDNLFSFFFRNSHEKNNGFGLFNKGKERQKSNADLVKYFISSELSAVRQRNRCIIQF